MLLTGLSLNPKPSMSVAITLLKRPYHGEYHLEMMAEDDHDYSITAISFHTNTGSNFNSYGHNTCHKLFNETTTHLKHIRIMHLTRCVQTCSHNKRQLFPHSKDIIFTVFMTLKYNKYQKISLTMILKIFHFLPAT